MFELYIDKPDIPAYNVSPVTDGILYIYIKLSWNTSIQQRSI